MMENGFLKSQKTNGFMEKKKQLSAEPLEISDNENIDTKFIKTKSVLRKITLNSLFRELKILKMPLNINHQVVYYTPEQNTFEKVKQPRGLKHKYHQKPNPQQLQLFLIPKELFKCRFSFIEIITYYKNIKHQTKNTFLQFIKQLLPKNEKLACLSVATLKIKKGVFDFICYIQLEQYVTSLCKAWSFCGVFPILLKFQKQ